MAGGKIRLLWDRTDEAVVTINSAGGSASTAFTVDGSPVTFPYDLSGDTTFSTVKGDIYSVSVKLNDVEIASATDAAQSADLSGTGSQELIFAPSPKDGFSSPAEAGGGGFDYSGEGAPDIDPDVAGVGKTYIDTEHGALYLTILNPTGPAIEWVLVGGEIGGANENQGIILGNGIAVVATPVNGVQAIITDVDGYEDSGNGIMWAGSGEDGGQYFRVRTGAPGSPKEMVQYADGGVDLPGEVYVAGAVHATTALTTKGATAPANGDIQAGQCFMYFDSTNGSSAIKFKGKSANGTVVSGTIALT